MLGSSGLAGKEERCYCQGRFPSRCPSSQVFFRYASLLLVKAETVINNHALSGSVL